ncbi:hypothetical protein [Streptomyces niveus]|uniref:hypothetical protein n=1 Tax=Streptomyces niveus TaxID=193462 RepID=UPI00363DDE69
MADPFHHPGQDADETWRATLVTRFGTVRPFLKLLVKVVDFGAPPEGVPRCWPR